MGQFVSRYYVRTVRTVKGGLDLMTYEKDWKVTAENVFEVNSWLADELG